MLLKDKKKGKTAAAPKRGADDPQGSQAPKKQKSSQAEKEKVKEGFRIEFRSSVRGHPLVQADFDRLEFVLLHTYLDLEEPNLSYKMSGVGIASGGVWYSCENETTREFLRTVVPSITPPAGAVKYNYVEGEGDLRHIRIHAPIKFWMTRVKFVRAMKLQNSSLETYTDDDGNRVLSDFIIIRGLEPENYEQAKRDRGFKVTMQVHVAVVMAIVQLGGRIDMGHSKVKVTGGGIEAMVKELKNPEDDDANSVINGV